MDPRFFLRNTAKKVRLRPEDDQEVFSSIMRFARENPVAATPRDALYRSETLLGRLGEIWHSPLLVLRPAPLVASVVLLLVFGIGVAKSADNALPGDFLYPVKINLNERAQASLLFSRDSRAQFEVERLEKRLEEATRLAATGRLGMVLKSSVSDGIRSQLTLTQQAAASLADDGNNDAALDVHSQIETDLVANAAVLASMINNSGSSITGVKDLLTDVSNAEHLVTLVRQDSEKKIPKALPQDQKSVTERNMQLAMTKIQDAVMFLVSNSANADSHIVVQSDARIAFAKRMFSSARAQIDAGQYDEAGQSIGAAIRAAMEAKAMLRLSVSVGPQAGQ